MVSSWRLGSFAGTYSDGCMRGSDPTVEMDKSESLPSPFSSGVPRWTSNPSKYPDRTSYTLVTDADGNQTLQVSNRLRYRLIMDRPTVVTKEVLAIAAPRLIRISNMIPSDMLPLWHKRRSTSSTWAVTDRGLATLYDILDELADIFATLERNPVGGLRSVAMHKYCRTLIDAYKAPYMGFTSTEQAEVIPALETIATWTTLDGANSWLLAGKEKLMNGAHGLLHCYRAEVREYMVDFPSKFVFAEPMSQNEYKPEDLVSCTHCAELSSKSNVETGEAPLLAGLATWVRPVQGGAASANTLQPPGPSARDAWRPRGRARTTRACSNSQGGRCAVHARDQ
jgi:hypothetical protein